MTDNEDVKMCSNCGKQTTTYSRWQDPFGDYDYLCDQCQDQNDYDETLRSLRRE